MRTRISLLALLASLLTLALVLPAGAAAKSGGPATKLAAKACVQEKKAIGNKAFTKRYGRKAMPACIRRSRGAARKALASATAECQAEVDDFGLDEFLQDWDSFEECVAETAEFDLIDDSADDELDEDEGFEDF